MYLIDTNVFIEYFLGQERAAEVEHFFERMTSEVLFISEFSLHTIGIILAKKRMKEKFTEFVQEEIIDGKIQPVKLPAHDLRKLIDHSNKYNLDFDDAYQYTAAEKYNLEIVSFAYGS